MRHIEEAARKMEPFKADHIQGKLIEIMKPYYRACGALQLARNTLRAAEKEGMQVKGVEIKIVHAGMREAGATLLKSEAQKNLEKALKALEGFEKLLGEEVQEAAEEAAQAVAAEAKAAAVASSSAAAEAQKAHAAKTEELAEAEKALKKAKVATIAITRKLAQSRVALEKAERNKETIIKNAAQEAQPSQLVLKAAAVLNAQEALRKAKSEQKAAKAIATEKEWLLDVLKKSSEVAQFGCGGVVGDILKPYHAALRAAFRENTEEVKKNLEKETKALEDFIKSLEAEVKVLLAQAAAAKAAKVARTEELAVAEAAQAVAVAEAVVGPLTRVTSAKQIAEKEELAQAAAVVAAAEAVVGPQEAELLQAIIRVTSAKQIVAKAEEECPQAIENEKQKSQIAQQAKLQVQKAEKTLTTLKSEVKQAEEVVVAIAQAEAEAEEEAVAIVQAVAKAQAEAAAKAAAIAQAEAEAQAEAAEKAKAQAEAVVIAQVEAEAEAIAAAIAQAEAELQKAQAEAEAEAELQKAQVEATVQEIAVGNPVENLRQDYFTSATKMMLATTPLYWAPQISTSFQEEGMGSKCMEAVSMTVLTTIMDCVLLSAVINMGLTFVTGVFAAIQLVDAYNTWNKYSALKAETGESEGSRLPILGLQVFVAGTALSSIAGVGLLAGVSTPIIVGVTGAAQLALHLYADKVIADKREGIVQAEMARG